jgi:chemotaxis protein MotB
MNRPKKHQPHEEHVDESWLIPYADLLTLLLALFIVLFATATPDQEKYNAMIQALYQAFNGRLPAAADGVDAVFPDGAAQAELGDDGSEDGAGKGIDSLKAALDQYVQDNAMENMVSVELSGDNILITLKNDVCFEPGSKQVTAEMKVEIGILGQILKENQNEERPFEIIVAGHTDNVPTNTPGYTNWDLSVDRALECLRLFISDAGLNPEYFSVRGYGELQPVADNGTVDGRLRNRRVEVLISQSAGGA